jgi:ubiquinone/menaquinone biosynthesis C-methylase UbiE
MSRPHAPSRLDIRQSRRSPVGLARELIRDPAQVEAVDKHFRKLLDDPAARDAIERDPIPIPATEDREGYFGERHLAYWLSGFDDLRVVQSLVPATAMNRVLDFGGASGRFARHVVQADDSAIVTIADLNVNHVAWVDRYFGPSVRAVKVSPYPHLPLADNSNSLCVGLSVFTHIDSYETGWLAEIHRVLAVDGYAVLTVHSEHTWPLVPYHTAVMHTMSKIPEFTAAWRPGEPLPKERMVFTYDPDSIEHNCNVFMHSDYIRRCWGKWFEVVEIRPQAHHNFQTVVCLRKRD